MAKHREAENNPLGFDAVEALLAGSQSWPGQRVAHPAEPNDENRAQLADLEALMGHLRSAFTAAQAVLWLEGQDPNLGARPLDVYRLEGPAPVIVAIRAYEQEAFA